MSISVSGAAALEVWFDKENLWLRLANGRQLAVPLTYFPRLLHASPDQCLQFELSGSGTGIHWPELYEDISVLASLPASAIRPARTSPLDPLSIGVDGEG